MKIKVKNITLSFIPSNLPILNTNCNIELTLCFNDNKKTILSSWCDICIDTAKSIYESSYNKSLALINSIHQNNALSAFSKMKIQIFENEIPTTNWEKYEVWYKLKKQEIKIHDKVRKAQETIIGKDNYYTHPTLDKFYNQ